MDVGIFSAAQARAQGLGRHDVDELLAMGALVRVRRGWYARPEAEDWAVRVIAAGAHIGCLTGCRLHNLWVPAHGIHAVYGRGTKPRRSSGVTLHPLAGPQPATAVCGVVECLDHVIQYHDPETALVTLESAVNRGAIRTSVAHDLIAGCPADSASFLRHFHPAAESGSETRVRAFLQGLRVSVSAQVSIPGIGRVDLLVGDGLIIECDSEAHHGGDVDRDRRRDMAATRQGYAVVRLSWQQIWTTWDVTKAFLVDLVRTDGTAAALVPCSLRHNSSVFRLSGCPHQITGIRKSYADESPARQAVILRA